MLRFLAPAAAVAAAAVVVVVAAGVLDDVPLPTVVDLDGALVDPGDAFHVVTQGFVSLLDGDEAADPDDEETTASSQPGDATDPSGAPGDDATSGPDEGDDDVPGSDDSDGTNGGDGPSDDASGGDGPTDGDGQVVANPFLDPDGQAQSGTDADGSDGADEANGGGSDNPDGGNGGDPGTPGSGGPGTPGGGTNPDPDPTTPPDPDPTTPPDPDPTTPPDPDPTTPPVDTTSPTVAIALPRPGPVDVPFVISGTASDDRGVAAVELRIVRRPSGDSWDPATGTWTPMATWSPVTLSIAGATETPWLETTFATRERNGTFEILVRARDAAGNVGLQDRVVVNPRGRDTTAPQTVLSSPESNDRVDTLVLAGTVSDDQAVGGLEWGVRDVDTDAWFVASEQTWSIDPVWNLASVPSPFAAMAPYSVPVDVPDGAYEAFVRAVDVAANVDESPASAQVHVSARPVASLDLWLDCDDDGPVACPGETLDSIPAGRLRDEVMYPVLTDGLSIAPNLDPFGARVRVLLVAQDTGMHTFWLASDDHGVLRLDDGGVDPASARDIARVPNEPGDGWTDINEWDKFPSQQSEPIFLEEGKRYYLEAMFKDRGGPDGVSVAWQVDGTDNPQLVDAAAVVPAGDIGAGGWRPPPVLTSDGSDQPG